MQNQEEVWDNIANEWHEFKQRPSKKVMEFLDKQTGNVLDLGSGSGRQMREIKNGKMTLVDFSSEMLKLAKQKAKEQNIEVEIIKSRLGKLPFEDNYFTAAIAISSLHCIETAKERNSTVKELFRVLKPKSEVLFATYNRHSRKFKGKREKIIRWRKKGERYYYLFDEEEIHDLFKKHGFKITEEISHYEMIVFIAKKI